MELETETRTVVLHYKAGFEKEFNEEAPVVWAKDGAIAKRLLKTYSRKRLCELLDAFFVSDDPWIKHSGYTFGVFSTVIGKLITTKGRKADRLQGLRDFING